MYLLVVPHHDLLIIYVSEISLKYFVAVFVLEYETSVKLIIVLDYCINACNNEA